ncbi:MAG: ROK family protein [Bacteroidales bacterium]|nr:MAG: ROK family protein [Bacteroidales bacterium]
MAKRKYVIGVDLGGTKTEACLMDTSRNVSGRLRFPSKPHLGLDHVIGNIVKLVNRVSDNKPVAAIGIGTAGTYNPAGDILHGAPHTPVYETPGFIRKLREVMKAPLVVENDANCLALAEYFESCEGKYTCVMAVIMGTGFGCGLVLNGKLYRGATGGAGEIGHTTVNYMGRQCECGRSGCAESYLSGPSHSRRYFELTGKQLNIKEIWKLYERGDRYAIRLFDESCLIMGEVFANAVNVLDLEAIILGGGVSNIPIWYEKVPPIMIKSFFGPPRDHIPILKAQLGDSAGVFGAAYLALREIGAMEF